MESCRFVKHLTPDIFIGTCILIFTRLYPSHYIDVRHSKISNHRVLFLEGQKAYDEGDDVEDTAL